MNPQPSSHLPEHPETHQGLVLPPLDSLNCSTPSAPALKPNQYPVSYRGHSYYEGFDTVDCLSPHSAEELVAHLEYTVQPQGSHSLSAWVRTSLENALTKDEWNAARVVGLGECTNGTQEHFAIQAAAARYMIEHHNARVMALEVPELFAMLANAAISDESSPLSHIPIGLPCSTWSNSPIIGLLEWIRNEWNVRNPRQAVRVVGLDPTISPNISINLDNARALDGVGRIFAHSYLPLAKKAQALERDVWTVYSERSSREVLSGTDLSIFKSHAAEFCKISALLKASLHALCDRFDAQDDRRSDFSRRSVRESIAHMPDNKRLLALNLFDSLSFLDSVIDIIPSDSRESLAQAFLSSRRIRDALMFKKIQGELASLVQKKPRHSTSESRNESASKIVALGHTMRIGVNTGDLPELEDLGRLLKQAHGDGYRAFAVSNVSGFVKSWAPNPSCDGAAIAPHYGVAPVGSLEDLLHRAGKGSSFMSFDNHTSPLVNRELALRMKGAGPPIDQEFLSGINPTEFLTGMWCLEKTDGATVYSAQEQSNSRTRVLQWLRMRCIDRLQD